jgi:hypothetical protein
MGEIFALGRIVVALGQKVNRVLSFAINPSGFTSRCNTFKAVMKATEFCNCYDRAIFHDVAFDRALFAERQMWA